MDYLETLFINALYCKIKGRNDNFKISKHKFKILFGISPEFYLYEYCSKIENQIYHTYNGVILCKYLHVLDFIKSIMTLLFSSIDSNSFENEYSQLYSYLNIININRSKINNKRPLIDRLFRTFLFSAPSPEEVVRKFRLHSKGIYYCKEDVGQILYEITNSLYINRYNCQQSISKINSILNVAYKYLIGSALFLPYYQHMDIYAYYFFNPLDFVNLYNFERNTFYELLNHSAVEYDSFMRRSFIYNCNLLLINSLEDIRDIKKNVHNNELIISLLLDSTSTLPNNILKDIKLGVMKI